MSVQGSHFYMNLEEASRTVEQLQAASPTSSEKIIQILKDLNDAVISKEVIEKSKIGIQVNRIRKTYTDSKEVQELATQILNKWKNIILDKATAVASTVEAKRQSQPNSTDEESTSKRQKKEEDDHVVVKKEKSLKEKEEEKNNQNKVNEEVVLSDVKGQFLTNDAIRDKTFEMLITALLVDSPSNQQPDELTCSLSRSIEQCLFTEFNHTTSPAYRSKLRSKYTNLKDPANAPLRQAILAGHLTPAQFSAMTPAEMASEERKRQNSLLEERNLREAKAVHDGEAETDQFKCGRCHQRKTKYYQLQTRSADEPMTTFVTCINCGNRWKFC